jgi:flagellar biosynthesis protein FlhB
MATSPSSAVGALQLPPSTNIFDSAILPALRLAKAGVAGIGIPGVEGAFNSVFELAEMVSVCFCVYLTSYGLLTLVCQTMKANKEDLSKLERLLNTLITIDVQGAGDELKQRLTTLALCVVQMTLPSIHSFVIFRELGQISLECKSFAEKNTMKRFFKSNEYKQQIKNIKNSVASCIQHFIVRMLFVSGYQDPALMCLLVLWQYID